MVNCYNIRSKTDVLSSTIAGSTCGHSTFHQLGWTSSAG